MAPAMIHLWIALFAWAFATLITVLWGVELAFRAGPAERSLRWLTALFLSIGITSALLLAAGVAGWLRPVPLLGFCAASSGPLALLLWRGRARFSTEAGLLRAARAARLRATPSGFADAAWLLLAVAQVYRIADHILVMPPFASDVLSYHLPKTAEWIQRGAIEWFNTPVPRTFWPSGYELYAAWFAVFPRHDFMIEAAGLPFYLLAAGSVYALARSAGSARRPAAWGGLVFTFVPVSALQSAGCSNDLAVTALFLYSAALLASAPAGGGPLRNYWAPAAAAAIFGIGIKPTAGFLAPGLLFLAIAARPGRVRPAGAAPAPVSPSATGILALVFLSAMILGGYWYWLNARWFGNPFHPTDIRLFGELVFAGAGAGSGQQGSFSLDSMLRNLTALATQRLDDRMGRFDADLTYVSGWGWTVFSCGWPALALGLARNRTLRRLAAAFAISLLFLLAMVTPDPWNLRFAGWFPALAAAGLAVHWSTPGWRPARFVLGSLMAACLCLDWLSVLSGGMTAVPGVRHSREWERMRLLPLLERSSAAYGGYALDAYSSALEAVPAGEPLAYHAGDKDWIYMLYGPDFSRRIHFLPLRAGVPLDAAMRELGTRFLFVAPDHPAVDRRLRQELERGVIRQIGRRLYVLADPPKNP